MDYSKLERLLYQIVTDRRFIRATRSSGDSVDLMIRSLNPEETAYSKFIYNRALNEARLKGLPTAKQCMSDAINLGLWNEDKDQLISLYKLEIDRLEKLKENYSHNKGRIIKLTNDVKVAQKKLDALYAERDAITAHSAESVARQAQSNYMISRVALDANSGGQLWPTYADFLKETDSKLIGSLVRAYSRFNEITEKELRQIARSGGWNIMWSAGKKSGNLFGRPTAHMTSDQMSLLYWSMMYDSVYESMERPSDAIIENDEKLDKWFEEQSKKRKDERKKKNNKSSTDRHPEQFIMVQSDEQADEVYEMNDKYSLARIRAVSKRLEDKQGQHVDTIELNQKRIKEQVTREHSDRLAAGRRAAASRRFV